jgi:hypothetical protein
MKYLPSFDIWQVPAELLSKAQPGQWVHAGDKSNVGRFWGVKKSGTIVVAWQGNAKNAANYRDYQETLRKYAKGR